MILLVNFCEKCGSLLAPTKKEDGSISLYCKVCKEYSKEKYKDNSYQIKSKINHSVKDKLTVIEEEFDVRPSIRVACPKCNHKKGGRTIEESGRMKSMFFSPVIERNCDGRLAYQAANHCMALPRRL